MGSERGSGGHTECKASQVIIIETMNDENEVEEETNKQEAEELRRSKWEGGVMSEDG